jgi:hypothetical protein
MHHASLVVQRADERRSFVTREIAGETLIVPVTGQAWISNRSTCSSRRLRIWELLRSPTTVDRIADAVAGEFSVSPQHAAADVAEFLERSARRA